MRVLALVLLAIVAGLCAALAVARSRSKRALQRAANDNAAVQRELSRATERIAVLSKYEGIIDAELHAGQVTAAAAQRAAEFLAQAQAEAAGLREVVEKEQLRATQETDLMRAAAKDEVRKATARAYDIVLEAQAKAKAIAGDAYEMKEQAAELEQTVRAMKNVIEGYGDQYLVPTFSVLDELAEEFGFTAAGEHLKEVRTRIRKMIKAGMAAACDYAEENRRTTAIHFVLDAFNGKVDSILADVRHDNYGTLQQKLQDAFALVNQNGAAFRNARITPAFLSARLEELRWAVAVHELKVRDREEQRALKERIREEEKAQREFERAAKEAEKEEATLAKAMEKARREFEKASGDQKAQYEAKLAELAEELRAAEEKNKRALSMAQQTKAGHVYVISNVGSFGENIYKIGLTRRLEPEDRIRELGDASVPFEFDIHALIRCDDAPALEHQIHKCFVRAQVNKVNARKEFFRATLQEIRAEVERIGCAASWTMTAACRDYKETLAIERALAAKTMNEGKWAQQQIAEHDAALQMAEGAEPSETARAQGEG